jgi:ABC-type uncharacterized transport system permease subunit
MLFGLFFSFLVTTLRLSQTIIGIAFNFLSGMGLSVIFFRQAFGVGGVVTQTPTINGFASVPIPFLSGIPIIGDILFNQPVMMYIVFILVALFTIIQFKTRFGLNIRAVGDNPAAADSLGVNVIRTRYYATIIAGAMAGLAGSFLVLVEVGSFFEGMIAGRGWIAIALVVFGTWHPLKIMLGALLFGGVSAFALRLQLVGSPIPFQFLLMLPYILTIVALVIGIRRSRGIAPEKLCVPYRREEAI